MSYQNRLLLIPQKMDIERDSIARAWESKGGEVMRIGKFWKKPNIKGKAVSLYGYDTFCLVLAQILKLEVISPSDEWLAAIDKKWTKRNISIGFIITMNQTDFPIFIKPVTPKLFQGKIYQTEMEFLEETRGLKDEEIIILSEIVPIEKEIRTFVLDGKIMDIAYYEGEGELEEAKEFARDFLQNTKIKLSKAFVLDLAYNSNSGWFVLEFNASWGAGLNSCNAEKVIDCIKSATVTN